MTCEEAEYDRCNKLLTRGHKADAVTALEIATETFPNSSQLWRLLGVALSSVGRELEALECYECAAAVARESEDAAEVLGLMVPALIENDDLDYADETVKTLSSVGVPNGIVARCHASLSIARDNPSEAITHIRKAMEHIADFDEPDRATADLLVLRAQAHVIAGEFAEAADVLRQSLDIDADAGARLFLVRVLLESGDRKAAADESARIDFQYLDEGQHSAFLLVCDVLGPFPRDRG